MLICYLRVLGLSSLFVPFLLSPAMQPTLDFPQTPPDGSRSPLSLESKLEDLILYNFQVSCQRLASEITDIFEDNPLLPGVVLLDRDEFAGMVSRRRFLELMSRRYGLELYSKRSLLVLHQFTQADPLILPSQTPILEAVQRSLGRSPESLYEPIVVQLEDRSYRLLDVHQLLLAQARIHQLVTQLFQEQTQAQLIQTEKMASLGQMIAGVAHEILNPVNFIWGNIEYLAEYGQSMMTLLAAYETENISESTTIKQIKSETDLEFVFQDFPQVIASMKMGAERLKKIIGALRNFSHMDEARKRSVDIHACIDDTLLILQNRIKNTVTVVKTYGELPPMTGYSGQLSQVFMNLIGNAVDALEEEEIHEPTIQIRTEALGNHWVRIMIADNGSGIAPEHQSRIFEPFFTTKPQGKGTGLGLAISHQIVTEKHNGQLKLYSQPGYGATFEILLPVA